VAVWLVQRIERHALSRRALVFAAAAYATAFAAAIGLFVPSSAGLNPVWRSFLNGQVPGAAAVSAGLPKEPVAWIEAVRDVPGARERLAEAGGPPHFPNLTPDRARQLAAQIAPPP
jgi:hypothetical protein